MKNEEISTDRVIRCGMNIRERIIHAALDSAEFEERHSIYARRRCWGSHYADRALLSSGCRGLVFGMSVHILRLSERILDGQGMTASNGWIWAPGHPVLVVTRSVDGLWCWY